MKRDRGTTRYDPAQDLLTRWRGWRVHETDLGGLPELISVGNRVIFVDLQQWPEGRTTALAHCIAHLDLGHHLTPDSSFSEEEEDLADLEAYYRLEDDDRECA